MSRLSGSSLYSSTHLSKDRNLTYLSFPALLSDKPVHVYENTCDLQKASQNNKET